MSLAFHQDNSFLFSILDVEYSAELKSFIAKNGSGDVIEFAYPLDIDDIYNIPAEEFEIHIFHRDNFAANDIFEVKLKGLRLGWFFPIQALLTNEHDFAGNQHFLPYAQAAYRILLLNPTSLPHQDLEYRSDVSLDKMYGENTFVFVLYKKYITRYEQDFNTKFSIDDFLIFFYKYGYTFLDKSNFSKFYNNVHDDLHLNFPDTNINLKNISKNLIADKIYINSLFQGLLKLENHPLVRFHLLYSLIELFISKIFEHEFSANLVSFQTTNDFYEAREKLNALANEKARINRLFESKCPAIDHGMIQELKNSCNTFLNYTDASKTYNKSAPESIYKVRSSIFHNLRLMPPDYSDYLVDVIEKLERVILEIVLKLEL